MNNILGWIGAILFLSTGMQAQDFSLRRAAGATQATATLEQLSRPLEEERLSGFLPLRVEGNAIWRPGELPTIAVQTGLGAASFIVAGVLTVPVAAVATRIKAADANEEWQLDAFFIITCFGASFGLAQGVIWGGDIYDGNGNGWLTLLASVAGVTAGGLTGWHIHSAAGWILGSTVAVAAPILTYHLSADPVYAAPAASSIRYAPANVYAFHPTGMENHLSLQVLSLPLQF